MNGRMVWRFKIVLKGAERHMWKRNATNRQSSCLLHEDLLVLMWFWFMYHDIFINVPNSHTHTHMDVHMHTHANNSTHWMVIQNRLTPCHYHCLCNLVCFLFLDANCEKFGKIINNNKLIFHSTPHSTVLLKKSNLDLTVPWVSIKL